VIGDVDLAHVGAVLADQTRAAMLVELLGGERLPAGELARRTGVSPSVASNHLRRLLEERFVDVVVAGRHRLYALSGARVAGALETLGTIAPLKRASSLKASQRYAAIREARTCYDHLAGRLGVELTERLVELHQLRELDAGYELGPAGSEWFVDLGVDVDDLRRLRRQFAPKCLDLTERRPHLAGALGAATAAALRKRRYIAPLQASRGLRITPSGRRFFDELGVAVPGPP
jgi:DNA-binding transcriptional ArsR family regulator